MTRTLTDAELLIELEPVVETNLNRHQSMAKEWHPHDYVPWDEGTNFAAMGGEDWAEEQSQLDPTAKAAMITNLLTEDNLPSYHREIATNFSLDRAWGTWVGTWTAEENRHSIVMRDYLVVTRGVDPVALERARMTHMINGYNPPGEDDVLHSLAYVTFQELATRVSHRNTGRACGDPVADRMLARVAADENLHMVFYRNLCEAAIDVAPDQAVKAVADVLEAFEMPGAGMPDFRRNAVLIAKNGIYDLGQHMREVVNPVLRKWKIFERTDLSADGERERERLGIFLEELEAKVERFETTRARALDRDRRRRESLAV